MGPYASYLVQTLLTLLAVCVLAFVVLYSARKLGVGRARGPVELVGQLPLDARRRIYLVRVGAQVLVVGVSEAGFTKLGEVPAADLDAVEIPPSVDASASFHDVLARVLGRKAQARSSRNLEVASRPTSQPESDHEARP